MKEQEAVTIRTREEALAQKWAGKADYIPVNNQQYSFDSLQRQHAFINAQFETADELRRYHQYREEWYRRAKEFDPGETPLAVTCELVSYCHLNCPMCYTITEEFQAAVVGVQRVLPWKIVTRIIDECAELGVASMLFSWRGESTLYRSQDDEGHFKIFPDVLAYARKKGILEITTLSNGQMIDAAMAEAIVDAEPSWISFSIDGLEKNYNKIRTPVQKQGTDYNAFQQLVETMKRIITLRDARRKTRPQIRTNTIYPPVADDPYAYHTFMENIGVGWVTVNEILDFRGEELPDEAIIEHWVCQYPFQRLTVSANGSILPCTGAHNEERDLLLGRYLGSRKKEITRQGRTEIIELPELSLQEAWKCQKLETIRKLHQAMRRKEIGACKHCRHGAVKHGVEWVPEDWDMEKMEWKGRVWRE
jgi:MoaA/NifB/PqqE/SkfB family radical SAM enzyme